MLIIDDRTGRQIPRGENYYQVRTTDHAGCPAYRDMRSHRDVITEVRALLTAAALNPDRRITIEIHGRTA